MVRPERKNRDLIFVRGVNQVCVQIVIKKLIKVFSFLDQTDSYLKEVDHRFF